MTMPSQSAFDEGVRLLQSGDARGAAAESQRAISDDPNNARAYQFLGIARSQTGDVNGGIAALREATHLDPTNAGISYNLGIALGQAQHNSEARSALERALALDPSHAKARAALVSLPGGGPSAPAPTLSAIGSTPEAFGGMPTLGGLGAASDTPASPGLTGMGGLSAIGGTPSAAPEPPSAYASAPQPPRPVLSPPASARPAGPGTDSVGGLRYVPASTVSAEMFTRTPTPSERLSRGLGWGALCGQWWTLWVFFWRVVVYGSLSPHPAGWAIVSLVEMLGVYGIIGTIIGVLVAVMDVDTSTGAIVGVVGGLVGFACDMFVFHHGLNLFNIFFWVFSGRYVGFSIARKVQAMIEK